MVKNGRTHIESLRDGRRIFIDGESVVDHTQHPAFRHAVATAASLYEYQAQPENLDTMTFVSPTSGDRVSRIWQLPTSLAELVERRRVLERWAELTCGMLGRSPDHVASCISGMYMGLDLFERHSPARASAVREYFSTRAISDLYLTYVIINPQADRSKDASQQSDEFLVAGVCDEDREGITIRGAKMLGTRLSAGQRSIRRRDSAAQAGRGEVQRHRDGAAQREGAARFSRASRSRRTPSRCSTTR